MATLSAGGTDGVGRERFLADAQARGLYVQIVERMAANSLEEAAGILGITPADVALDATGYERGTITPLGSTTAWPVYADRTITGRRISMGAGEHGYSAFVDADALTSALGAVVADISEPN